MAHEHDVRREEREHEHGHGRRRGHEHGHGGVSGLLSSLSHSHSHTSAADSTLETSREGIRAVKISLAGLLVTAALQGALFAARGIPSLTGRGGCQVCHHLHQPLDALWPRLRAFR